MLLGALPLTRRANANEKTQGKVPWVSQDYLVSKPTPNQAYFALPSVLCTGGEALKDDIRVGIDTSGSA